MEFKDLNKLFDKTKEDLTNCELKIENWNKFKSDYLCLKERLSTITDTTTQPIMVPIGGSQLVLMSGYIKHTNEILVLLGDNYFVERSAKQSIDIVNRRLEKCDQMIDGLNKEKSDLENWLSFSQQFSDENKSKDFVEIIEEYDEQREQMWREEHKRKVREYKQKTSKNLVQNTDSNDSELNQKLEKLEIQENNTQKHELKSILKKDLIKSETKVGNEKTVGFDETLETKIITNEEESYPLAKYDKRLNIESDTIEDKSHEIAFKSEVKERDITQNLTQTNISANSSSAPIVSRFKANRLKK